MITQKNEPPEPKVLSKNLKEPTEFAWPAVKLHTSGGRLGEFGTRHHS
jgi:hypothetical protein